MGCASGKPTQKRGKEPAPDVGQVKNSHQHQPNTYNLITIEPQKKESFSAGLVIQPQVFPAIENWRKSPSSLEAQEVRILSKADATNNKENKEESKKQMLKKYDIKVNNNSQRVLPVNSYRYDILLPHNPQISEEEPQIITVNAAPKE